MNKVKTSNQLTITSEDDSSLLLILHLTHKDVQITLPTELAREVGTCLIGSARHLSSFIVGTMKPIPDDNNPNLVAAQASIQRAPETPAELIDSVEIDPDHPSLVRFNGVPFNLGDSRRFCRAINACIDAQCERQFTDRHKAEQPASQDPAAADSVANENAA
ncbi:MAG: hypothetical protein V4719_10235 [Planctomycetota bacterium]